MSIFLKEATNYNPHEYNFARSSIDLSLDEIEKMAREDVDILNNLTERDPGLRKRYSTRQFPQRVWLEKIDFLRGTY